MIPSINYKNEMFAWKNNKEQNILMIQENCFKNKFIIEKWYIVDYMIIIIKVILYFISYFFELLNWFLELHKCS